MRACNNKDCQEINPQSLENFSFRKDTGKHRNICEGCKKSYMKKYSENNEKELKAYHKLYSKSYYKNNLEKCKQEKNEYRKKDPEKCRQRCRDHYAKNPDKKLLYAKINKEKIKEDKKKWGKLNPGLANARSAKYHAIKLKSTPIWLTKDQNNLINQKFLDAKKMSSKYEVDHIIPLQGKLVSGLHVPWNLQLLTQKENRIKSNKFDGTYDNESWRFND